MKKIIFLILLITSALANAQAIFVISPTITSTYLRSDSSTLIPYTVTNNTATSISNITIDPTWDISAHLSMINNTCSTLTRGASCTFDLLISGQNQPENFTISPEVCGFNKTVCSQPIATARLQVNVDTITQTVKAYVGLIDNTVLPITLFSRTIGAAISGFNLNEPAGISVNLAGTLGYVTNTGTNQIFVIDLINNKIINQFSVGSVPAAVVVSPDGSKLYVANYNNGQTNGSVTVLNSLTGALIATIPIGEGPWGLAITPDGLKLYVANSNENTVSVVNTTNNTVITSINVETTPLGIVASPDGTRIYVTNTQSHSVSVIDTTSNSVINTISVGNIPKGITISPDGSKLFVVNWQDGTLDIINTSNFQSESVTLITSAFGIAVNPNGSEVYVTFDQVNAIAIVNTATHSVQFISITAPQITMGNFIG